MTDLPSAASIAHHWHGTSFSPEKRAEHAIAGARAALDEFRTFVDEIAAEGGAIDAAAEFARFLARSVSLHRRAWAMQGGCVSWFIAGPSNFNVRRSEKRFASRDRAYSEIDAHTAAAREAVMRRAWPHGHPSGPVRGSNPDAPELLRARIDKKRKHQELMRQVNQAIRRAKPKTAEAQADAVCLLTGWSWATCQSIVKRDDCGRVGFAAYMLTNNLAEVRRLETRLKVIEARRAQGETSTERATVEGIVKVERDPAADRLRLIFPSKPSDATRSLLKGHGFRWSPLAGAWQRHLNGNGIMHAEIVLTKLAPEAA